jgi:uncharacterized protein (TIGR03437 family)
MLEVLIEFPVTAERRWYIQNNVRMNKLKSIALLLPIVACWPAAAQTWDTSGNGQLNGTYYFRQVIWAVEDEYGDVGEALAVYGTISFNGSGQYTVGNVTELDSNSGAGTIAQGTTGSYAISASGYGFLDSLVTSDEVYGLVSNGILVASSTENTSCQAGNNPCYNDLFIAVPVPSPVLTNSALQGTYAMANMDLTNDVLAGQEGAEGVLYNSAAVFQITPNGNGNIPGFTANGYIAGNGSTETSESVPSASYNFSNGAAVWNLQNASSLATNVLIAGQKYLYVSPDGNFVFGGSPQGFDMIVGVRTSTGGTTNVTGLYYQAGGLVNNFPLASNGYADLQTFYGSYDIFDSQGDVLVHQRLDDALNNLSDGSAIDFTYEDNISPTNGVLADSINDYMFANSGEVGIGYPTLLTEGGYLGVTVLLQAPSFSGSGTYIYPTGVVNAGSSAPFTAQLAPGELISIYGTNLASTTLTNLSLPSSLGGVTVTINGQQAPIASVGPGQINATVPIGLSPGSIASIQVNNNGALSNVVTNFIGATQPGVFNSVSAEPAIQHGANYSMVTSSSPAQPGETILLYLTGLGQLTSLGNSTNTFEVYFAPANGSSSEVQGTVSFSGSQSPIGGGYQMNVVVPTSLTSQDYILDIYGPDSENYEVLLPVGSGGTSSIRRSVRAAHSVRRKIIKPNYRRNPKAAAIN